MSSKHLTLASPVFKALLRGSFAESSDLQSDLSPEILLHDDDPAAFWLLLYIIHGRPKQVPNKIGLETLTQIALLVDKYELHEVSEVITDGWIEQIQEEDVPDCEHDIGKVAQLLCVAWVFRNPMMFSKMTFLAMQLSVGNFACVEAAHLPITAAVLGNSL